MNDQNVVSVRLTPQQADLVRARAATTGQTPSAYLRNAALREELRRRPGTRVFRASNGAEVLLWTNVTQEASCSA